MEQQFCQSCGMPLDTTNRGTNADGTPSNDYCTYCYQAGEFTQDFTMSQMIEFCARFTDQINKQAGWNLTPDQAKRQMRQFFPHLKRWQEGNGRTPAEQATALLNQCGEVTLASIDTEGFPHPAAMTRIGSKGCAEVWMVSPADTGSVADFRLNPKAGLCYSNLGDSVELRGRIEIITDDTLRKTMWQERFTDLFPDGPQDPNYVILHFVGEEAHFRIDGASAHEKL